MVLALKSATTNDVEIIAKMNFQLIEDEGSTNPMNITQLQDRMLNWLSHGWDADLLVFQEKIVGYAVYKFQMNSFDDTKKEVYIRQYFIKREERNRGYGLKGIALLKQERFTEVKSMIIDVLESNPRGKQFWEKAGFRPYYTNMKCSQNECK